MRPADTFRLAMNRLKRRWARTLFAIAVFVAAVTPILLILNLADGAQRAVQTGNRAYFSSTRWLEVSKLASTFEQADDDLASLRRLPGCVADAPTGREAIDARLMFEDGRSVSQLRRLPPAFFAEFVPIGSRVVIGEGEVPLVLGRLGILYRGPGQRRDVDVDSMVGRLLEIRVGEHAWSMEAWIEDPKTGAMRKRTREETREVKEAVRKRVEPKYHWDKFCEVLTLRARVVAIADGWQPFIPEAAARRIEDWRANREREARKTPAPAAPTGGAAVAEPSRTRFINQRILFASPAAATAALPALEDRGFDCGGYAVLAKHTREVFRTTSLLIAAVAGAVALLACVVIAGVVSRVVADSTREIGVLRALGARRGLVTTIYLLQAAAIAIGGAVVSLVTASAAGAAISAWVLAHARSGTTTIEIMGHTLYILRADLVPTTLHEFSLWQFPALGVAVLLALFAAWVPAHRAARLDPTEALRAR